jgi:hypothetical protein
MPPGLALASVASIFFTVAALATSFASDAQRQGCGNEAQGQLRAQFMNSSGAPSGAWSMGTLY